MQIPNYLTTIPQLKTVLDELTNHIGTKFYLLIFYFLLCISNIHLLFLDICEECFMSDLPSAYLEYISMLLPELQKLFLKFSIWWSFKPHSTLQSYLQTNNIFLDDYFCPDQLVNVILHQARKKKMFENGNDQIIKLDIELQLCLKTQMLYTPEILEFCQEHITPVSTEMSIKLLNQAIHNELFINVPEKIIFNDPSSLFWLHPDLNKHITLNKKIVFTWKEINDLFYDYITSENNNFIQKNETVFYINEHSELANLFTFKYFHKDQIENILKHVTRFLGKCNTIENCCKNITFSTVNTDIFVFIDTYINNFNKLLPHIPFAIDLNENKLV
jgi:hypothetical protein